MELNRRELTRVVAIALIAWVGVLILLARWQRSSAPAGTVTEPELIRYPGFEHVAEQRSENLGFRKYWFTLQEDFPTKSVYYFYRNELEQKGWKPVHRAEPQWQRVTAKRDTYDLLHAFWVSPNNLFQIELEMVSKVEPAARDKPELGEQRQPGIEVFVTQRRAMHPGIIMQPRPPEEPGTGIEFGH